MKGAQDDLMEIGVVMAERALPQPIRRAKEILEGLPAGKVMDAAALYRRLGIGRSASMVHPALKPYRIMLAGRRVYYGNKETIAKANIQHPTSNIQHPKGK